MGQLIGDPVRLRLDQIFLKPGKHGVGTNWHQDNAYFQIPDPLLGVALWTAVHAGTAANGTMRVIPGSFRTQYEHSRDGDSNHHVRCYPPEEEAVTIELPAGGALFFAYGVAHATGANTTDKRPGGRGPALPERRRSRGSPGTASGRRRCRSSAARKRRGGMGSTEWR